MELHHAQRPGHRPGRYISPTSLEEAMALLTRHGERARLIAGGTDLMVELDRGGRADVDVLIDLTRIDGLDSIHQSRHGIHLGQLVTHNQCVVSDLIQSAGLPLAQACWEVGSPALRNRATVVGNVVTASPANDTISALVALDAVVSMISERGLRDVPIGEFHTGVRQTVLAPDELVTGLTFPALEPNRRGVYVKLGLRRAQAISVVHLTIVATISESGEVSDTRVVLGSVAPTVGRISSAEHLLDGQSLTDDVIEAAAAAAAAAVTPIDDLRAPATYRVDQIHVMVQRALRALRSGTEQQMFPVSPPTLGGPAVASQATPAQKEMGSGDRIVTSVDGSGVEAAWTGQSLLTWLRDEADITATKEGCAEGECGACTVQLDGTAVLSCLVPAGRADGSEVVTANGLRPPEKLGSLQERFVDAAAVQCGFCIPGFIVAGRALESEFAHPTATQIEQGLAGNLCRCTGYYKIKDAFS